MIIREDPEVMVAEVNLICCRSTAKKRGGD